MWLNLLVDDPQCGNIKNSRTEKRHMSLLQHIASVVIKKTRGILSVMCTFPLPDIHGLKYDSNTFTEA